jgi:hypothetical protein
VGGTKNAAVICDICACNFILHMCTRVCVGNRRVVLCSAKKYECPFLSGPSVLMVVRICMCILHGECYDSSTCTTTNALSIVRFGGGFIRSEDVHTQTYREGGERGGGGGAQRRTGQAPQAQIHREIHSLPSILVALSSVVCMSLRTRK